MVSYTAHCIRGYFEYYSRVAVDKRLPGCEYGQCGIILEPGCEKLVSYDVVIAEKDAQGWIKVFACPSRTSCNHLSKWGKSFEMGYRTLSDLCYRRKEYNLYTGEERDATYNPESPLENVGLRIRE